MPRPLRLSRALSVGMGVKSKLSTMLNTTPAPSANTLPYVTLPYVLLTFHTQSVLDLKYRSAPSFSTQRSSLPCHSERSAAVYSAILNAAPSLPCHSERSPLLPCHSQRSAAVLPCHSQRSAAVYPVILERSAAVYPVILNAAQQFYPVILNAAQRSEESKIIAHPPFTDLTFLPSLETTRPKSSHPERSIPSLPSRTQPPPSCHSERSAAVYPVILNAAQQFTLSF